MFSTIKSSCSSVQFITNHFKCFSKHFSLHFLELFLYLSPIFFLISCSQKHPETVPQIHSNFDRTVEDPYLKKISKKEAENKILVLLPLSGSNAQLGRGILDACILAAKENGNSDIDFVVIDTADQKLNINEVLWKCDSANLRAVIGPIFFNEARRYAALFPNTPIFTFSNNKEINNNHIFTCGISPQDETDAIFRYARKTKKKDFLIMLPKKLGSEEIMKYLRKSMKRFKYSEKNDVEVIRYEHMRKEEATRYVANSGKRAVFILEPIVDIAKLPSNIDVFSLSSNAMLNKNAWDGCIFAFSSIDELIDFSSKYSSTFGRTPTTLDVIGYDITSALCKSATDDNAPFSLENKHLHGCLGDFCAVKNKGLKRNMDLYRNTPLNL